ncbi:HET-domain-containing protein [Penicillium cataractarum]|uniref:HET-domain-containing protein n=1 Tax=Penicillium cataractarum TaxID=2100454 RepID=A0A9W9RQK8_9EURO|nr:HET-domain-containing protein [Penicillium cataractarum]KAJ5364597.1 HET-domain-containing protein [Penicillium cataractarum]
MSNHIDPSKEVSCRLVDNNIAKTNILLRIWHSSNNADQKIVSMLLSKGADVNVCRGNLGKCYQAVSFSGSQETVKLIFDDRADVNAQTKEQRLTHMGANTATLNIPPQ